MSTRSRIAYLESDGTIHSVYCHCDGYLSHNGIILEHYYKNFNKVKELISLGDISSLGITTEYRTDSEDTWDDKNFEDGFFIRTRDYNRWRNEGTKEMVFNSIYDYLHYDCDCMEEYLYLYIPFKGGMNGMWFVITAECNLYSVEYALKKEGIIG